MRLHTVRLFDMIHYFGQLVENTVYSGTAKIYVISRGKQNRPSSAYYSMPKKMGV
jgi:hypothetical protein